MDKAYKTYKKVYNMDGKYIKPKLSNNILHEKGKE